MATAKSASASRSSKPRTPYRTKKAAPLPAASYKRCKASAADDLVLCLISGGGSALLTFPAPGLTLADKQEVNRALLRSGANIGEMNTVRKHLSAIKGGRLAIAAQPARVLSWLISDVPNDDAGVIASGPTVADRTTFADALAVLAKYRIEPPSSVRAHLEAGAAGLSRKRPSPAIRAWRAARPSWWRRPAAHSKPRRRWRTRGAAMWSMLGDNLEGEARELGARTRARPSISPPGSPAQP